MKTEFVDSELEVIRFAEKDIIMSSSCGSHDELFCDTQETCIETDEPNN